MSPLRAYNVLLLPLVVLVAPIAGAVCLVRPSWRRGLAARLGGGWPASRAAAVLWAHAASVGEVEGIAPLVRRWQETNPGGGVVFSALTATGCEAARRLVPGATVQAFPLDLPWVVRRVVRRVRPRLFLFSENEIWPNAIAELDRSGATVVQVSGRLSERTARTLGRFPRLSAEVLGRVALFCVQGTEHCARLVELGAAAERVVVTGSLKADERTPPVPDFAAALTALGRPVLVAGSTHGGEETAVLDAAARLADRVPRPLVVLAPRHPERFAQVDALLARRGVRFVRRTELGDRPEATALVGVDVLLLDTIGELAGSYTVADVAFVGGTLVAVGGHNLLEPARAGVPIVVGPHRDAVAALATRLVERGAAAIVCDAEELAAAFARFLDPGVRQAARAAAHAVAEEEAGGLSATWKAIEALGEGPRGGRVAAAGCRIGAAGDRAPGAPAVGRR